MIFDKMKAKRELENLKTKKPITEYRKNKLSKITAIYNKEATFYGGVCKNCGYKKRYTINHCCVECVKTKQKLKSDL